MWEQMHVIYHSKSWVARYNSGVIVDVILEQKYRVACVIGEFMKKVDDSGIYQ